MAQVHVFICAPFHNYIKRQKRNQEIYCSVAMVKCPSPFFAFLVCSSQLPCLGVISELFFFSSISRFSFYLIKCNTLH